MPGVQKPHWLTPVAQNASAHRSRVAASSPSIVVTCRPPLRRAGSTGRDNRRPGYPVSPMMSAFFFSRSETIWGGTSQIQRNIVGERVLGLPKEPQAPNA